MLARRVCRRDPLPRRPRKFAGRGPKLALVGGVRNLQGAKRTSEGERASAGRGCSERGTLNASTVENPIWSCVELAHLVVSEMKPKWTALLLGDAAVPLGRARMRGPQNRHDRVHERAFESVRLMYAARREGFGSRER